MNDSVDRYDVADMIGAALLEVRRELADLRQELRDTHAKLEGEIQATERVLASRTEHLV